MLTYNLKTGFKLEAEIRIHVIKILIEAQFAHKKSHSNQFLILSYAETQRFQFLLIDYAELLYLDNSINLE